ncbi:MAG: glycoside hydrolase family 3 protein [Nitrospirae bacterium]|nr:glycoside hydrolase family 3 protein [Nitrospirota bacterium]
MDIKKKIAQLIIARLDGQDIRKKFSYYQSLVKKGIGGFIIFGGEVKEVSSAIKKLQAVSEIPLFISSDIERGLGQQLEGATVFPPAMAVANTINKNNASDIRLLRKSISIIAKEARAAGINVIFSPVMDVNTNPQNPIICTRAFSDNPSQTAWFGREFIKGFQKHGLIACAKHFPGHGNTSRDSHKELPVVRADMKRLRKVELHPFKEAIQAGVKMIMVGHLMVPAIDKKFPSSLSEKTITGFLKNKMGFKGLVITDAMNMQALKSGEEKASLLALNAGTDIILHPSNPERVIDYLASKWDEIKPRAEESLKRILDTKKAFILHPSSLSPAYRTGRLQHIGGKTSRDLAYKLTQKSLKVKLDKKYSNLLEILYFTTSKKESPIILVIDDDNMKSGETFVNVLKKKYGKLKAYYTDNKTILSKNPPSPPFVKGGMGGFLIIAVFSKISAWKGRSGLSKELQTILKTAVGNSKHSLIIGFCCPYFLSSFKADAVIEAYSDSEAAQESAAEMLFGPL